MANDCAGRTARTKRRAFAYRWRPGCEVGREREREREVPEVHFHDEVGHPVYLAVTEASSHYDARVEAMGVGQDLGS